MQKERVGLDGFVGEAAAAGLFPGEMLVEDGDGVAGAGQLFAAERAGGAAADDCDFSHQGTSGAAKFAAVRGFAALTLEEG